MPRQSRQILKSNFMELVERRRIELGVTVTEWVQIIGMSRPAYYRLQYTDGEMRLDSFLRMIYYTETPVEFFMNPMGDQTMKFDGDKTVGQLVDLLTDPTFEEADRLRKAIAMTWNVHQVCKNGSNE